MRCVTAAYSYLAQYSYRKSVDLRIYHYTVHIKRVALFKIFILFLFISQGQDINIEYILITQLGSIYTRIKGSYLYTGPTTAYETYSFTLVCILYLLSFMLK